MKIERSLLDYYYPSWINEEKKHWVANDTSKLKVSEKNLLNYFLNHLFGVDKHVYPYFIPSYYQGSYSLQNALNKDGVFIGSDKTIMNTLSSLREKGKLLHLRRYWSDTNKNWASVFMPYPTIFLQPAFIPMFKIKFPGEHSKESLLDNYHNYSIRTLDYRKKDCPVWGKYIEQGTNVFSNLADRIADYIFYSSIRGLDKKDYDKLRFNKNDVNKQLFNIRDIFYKQEVNNNIKANKKLNA